MSGAYLPISWVTAIKIAGLFNSFILIETNHRLIRTPCIIIPAMAYCTAMMKRERRLHYKNKHDPYKDDKKIFRHFFCHFKYDR